MWPLLVLSYNIFTMSEAQEGVFDAKAESWDANPLFQRLTTAAAEVSLLMLGSAGDPARRWGCRCLPAAPPPLPPPPPPRRRCCGAACCRRVQRCWSLEVALDCWPRSLQTTWTCL